MVVGEPTLMGGEFGDEDERLISRLENAQFEPNSAEEDAEKFQNSPALQHSPWGQDKKPSTATVSSVPSTQAEDNIKTESV